MNLVEINNLTKKYEKKTILKDISLTVEEGEFVCIHGKSGCGKSTLLNIIGLIEKYDSGSVKLFGNDINRTSIFARQKLIRYKIGYLFQNYALIDDNSVMNNLLIGMKYIKESDKIKKSKISETLKLVGLDGYEKKMIYKLSGGEQQRVAIARIMLKPSELILADEPTGSLDPENRDIVMDLLKKLNNEGKTILLVSHDVNVVKSADRVVDLL